MGSVKKVGIFTLYMVAPYIHEDLATSNFIRIACLHWVVFVVVQEPPRCGAVRELATWRWSGSWWPGGRTSTMRPRASPPRSGTHAAGFKGTLSSDRVIQKDDL